MNQVLCDILFDGRFNHLPVYLDLEGSVLADAAAELGVTPEDCPDVVASAAARSLTWDNSNPFALHTGDLSAWNELGRFEPPPFIGLLCALTIAADRMRSDNVYSAHNYYERLFEVLGVTDDTRKTKLRHHAKSIKPFWDALNHWLAEQDFEVGKPTARRVNDWPYVSFALSQALVRDADRQRFHRMFAEFGFRPGEHLGEQEMLLYLHDWMRGSSASAWLRKLWGSPELRARVAQAACAELEQWDGAERGQVSTNERGRPLNWAAALISFPSPRLQLYLTAPAGSGGSRRLSLGKSTSPAASQAFRDCDDGIWLADADTGEFAILGPIEKIAIRPLMLGSFQLREDDKGQLLTRVARPIVPLLKLDTGAYYREVSRISLLRPHLILCHEQWGERVGAHLRANARPGFTVSRAVQLPGLPHEWLLFRGVELITSPGYVPDDLAVLAPLAEGVSVNMDGGLRLAQGLWHSEAPPELVAAASSGNVAIELRESNLARGPRVVAKSASQRLAATLSLEDADLPSSGDFTVAVLQDGKVKSESALSLRSADQPRRHARDARSIELGLGPAQPLSVLRGTGDAIGSGQPALKFKGLIVEVAAAQTAEAAIPEIGGEIATDGDDESRGSEAPAYGQREATGLTETCLLRGYHVWHCEAFKAGDDPNAPRWMTCQGCNETVLTRNRIRRKRPPVSLGFQRNRQPVAPVLPPKEERSVDADLLFDGVCYIGSGTWPRLLSLAGEEDGDPWFPHRFADNLRQLGHIDALGADPFRRPESWTCTPPALVTAHGGKAYLAGFRSASLVSAIADRIGAPPNFIVQAAAPPLLMWDGLSAEAAERAIDGAQDPFGNAVRLVETPAFLLASYSPTLSAVAEVMPEIHVEDLAALERFDLHKGRWRRTDSIDQSGAYRLPFAGMRYFFKSAEGRLRAGSVEIVKLLAARAQGIRLHSYVRSERTFEAVIGCPPPGMLARALVSCSGRLPALERKRMTYRDIPPEVAAVVLHKLYS